MSQRTVILRINRIFSHLDCRTERLEDWRTAGPDARGQTAGLADWRTGGLRIKKVMHRDARQPLMGCGGAKQQTPTAAGLGLDCLSANCRPAVSRRNSPPTTRLSGLEDSRSETGTKLMPTLKRTRSRKRPSKSSLFRAGLLLIGPIGPYRRSPAKFPAANGPESSN